jgi:site-specific DNA-methyltransferase (adenine-specific)
MTHFVENGKKLHVETLMIHDVEDIGRAFSRFRGVMFLRLPVPRTPIDNGSLMRLQQYVSVAAKQMHEESTLVIFGDIQDLVDAHFARPLTKLHYRLLIAVHSVHSQDLWRMPSSLPHRHLGLAVYTKYEGPLHHTTTRIVYAICPACGRTTKDYGGKRHIFHENGTMISDVWTDISISDTNIQPVIDRIADLFGIDSYTGLRVCDLRDVLQRNFPAKSRQAKSSMVPNKTKAFLQLSNDDCYQAMKELDDASVDFVFADPPYNLGKDYHGYIDSRTDYLAWCMRWIGQASRLLKPGRTFALLNMPLWAIRHFSQLETELQFQNWIVWDAMSIPVRHIMPAHYAILCFSKGQPRPLPGLEDSDDAFVPFANVSSEIVLSSLADSFCLRSSCVRKRNRNGLTDRVPLTDVWTDIHRLRHNSRRVDHPSQLPPALLYRLIALFTRPNEVVLDPFNGAGTTTLAAHQLGRDYIGIELSSQYHAIALARHKEIEQGIDPFRIETRPLTSKNSYVPRVTKRNYQVSKKTLQLDVVRVAHILDRAPTRADIEQYGNYPIQFYDEYFLSWSEASAAVRMLTFNSK